MNKITILGFLAIAVAAQAADFAGHYYLKNLREVGSELLLRPDGNFEFMLATGAADYSAKGKWRAQGDTVILNSTPIKDAAPFKLVRSSAAKEEWIRVHVQAPNGGPVPNIGVSLQTDKGPLKAQTDSSGDALFPRESPARSVVFDIRVYELETEPLKVDAAHDDFIFQINGEAITQVSFKDERLTSKGKALIMLHWGPDREMRYEK